MKQVLCIRNSNSTRIDDYLVIGKLYTYSAFSHLSGHEDRYILIDDPMPGSLSGIAPLSNDWYPADWFITIGEKRDLILDKILE